MQKCIGLLWKVPYEPIPEIEFTLHSSYKTTPQLSSHMKIYNECKPVYMGSYTSPNIWYKLKRTLEVLHLPKSWYKDIYRQGLAILDGHLVLEINKGRALAVDINIKDAALSASGVLPHKYIDIVKPTLSL